MKDGTIVGISRDWRPVSKVFRQRYFIVIDWRQDGSTIRDGKSDGWALQLGNTCIADCLIGFIWIRPELKRPVRQQ